MPNPVDPGQTHIAGQQTRYFPGVCKRGKPLVTIQAKMHPLGEASSSEVLLAGCRLAALPFSGVNSVGGSKPRLTASKRGREFPTNRNANRLAVETKETWGPNMVDVCWFHFFSLLESVHVAACRCKFSLRPTGELSGTGRCWKGEALFRVDLLTPER